MRPSIKGRKSQRCVAYYIKYSINLFKSLLKESGWTSQLVCNVCLRNMKNNLLTLELDPLSEHTKQRL